MRSNIIILILSITFLVSSCKKNPDVKLSSIKQINSFALNVYKNSGLSRDIFATISNDSIVINLKAGETLSTLKPTISFSGKLLSPSDSLALDFSKQITYLVTAEDGTYKQYKTYIHYMSSDKKITSFVLKKQNNSSLSSDVNALIIGDSIYLGLAQGLSVTSLVPSIQYTGVSISPANEMPYDFSQPIKFTVTAEDNSSKVYTVFLDTNSDVFVHADDGYLYDINAASGTSKWKVYIPGNGIPTYDNNTVFVLGTTDKTAYAINVLDGSIKWQTSLPFLINLINATPIAKNGNLFCSSGTNSFVLSQSTGNLKWSGGGFTTGFSGTCFSPAADSSIVCAYNNAVGLAFFDINTGNLIWRNNDILGRGGPKIINNIVYYSGEGSIHAVDKTKIQEIWAKYGYNFTTPQIAGGKLFTSGSGSSTGSIFALHVLTGVTLWSKTSTAIDGTGSPITFCSPSVSADNLYTINGNGLLYSYSVNDGTQNWVINGYYASPPLVANNSLYVCDKNKRLCSIDTKTGSIKWVSQESTSISNIGFVIDISKKVFFGPETGN